MTCHKSFMGKPPQWIVTMSICWRGNPIVCTHTDLLYKFLQLCHSSKFVQKTMHMWGGRGFSRKLIHGRYTHLQYSVHAADFPQWLQWGGESKSPINLQLDSACRKATNLQENWLLGILDISLFYLYILNQKENLQNLSRVEIPS